MDKILMDSGPMIALFDGSDKYYKASVEFIKNNSAELIMTFASITETLHLLSFSRHAQTDFLQWIYAGAVKIENISSRDFHDIAQMMLKYADLPMDFADACLVFVADKLKIDTIATIDRDFDIYRLKKKRTFTTLIK